MITVRVAINEQTKIYLSSKNITDSGLSNDKPNTYNLFINGRDTTLTLEHMRDDGYLVLVKKMFELVNDKALKLRSKGFILTHSVHGMMKNV